MGRVPSHVKVDRDATVVRERKEPPMELKIVCHFPKDNCAYCKDGVEHTHRYPETRTVVFEEWAGRNDH